MDYIIAGIRIRVPQRLGSGVFGAALSPFIAKEEAEADLIIETTEKLVRADDYRELDSFKFSDADTDCLFGCNTVGYWLTMTPSDGTPPATFVKGYDSKLVRCDIGDKHNPSLFRFGLWLMFNITAVTKQAVAIHTSVICCNGQAVLFLGESGTGKSTHTKLWLKHISDSELLNDDSPIVRVFGSGVEAFGSPWSGKTPCYRNLHYPIRAIVRLSQAPHNKIRRLRPIEAIGALLPSCPPSFAHDEVLHDAVCKIVSAIVKVTPFYHLECLPDEEAARLSFSTIFGDL